MSVSSEKRQEILQLLATGKITVDVISVAALGWFHELLERGELLKYDSPEYKFYGPARRAGRR